MDHGGFPEKKSTEGGANSRTPLWYLGIGGDLAGRPWTGRVGERVPHIRDAQMLDRKVHGATSLVSSGMIDSTQVGSVASCRPRRVFEG